MAKLHIISSGSKGNSYIIEADNGILCIELGIKFDEIIRHIQYRVDISGILVSHIHFDHSKYIPRALQYLVPVYSCKEVADAYPGVNVLLPNHKYKIGNFMVQPMHVPHNAENYAYLIENNEFGRLLFFTDCTSFPYKVKGVNHILAEANYDQELVLDKVIDGEDIRSHNENHCEINDTISALESLKSEELNTIVLIHLSDYCSDEESFKKRVYDATGIEPYVADKNQVIEINKEEF